VANATHRDGRLKGAIPFFARMVDALAKVPIKDMPMRHRIVLLVLSKHARPDGSQCWPKVTTVRASCGMGEWQWFRTLRELEEARWLRREHRTEACKKRQTSNAYHLELNGGRIRVTQRRTVRGLGPEPTQPGERPSVKH
jgi:hypothetical protein